MHDYRKAELTPRERALCDFAVKLTHLAAEVGEDDIEKLRKQGLPTSTSPTRSRSSATSTT